MLRSDAEELALIDREIAAGDSVGACEIGERAIQRGSQSLALRLRLVGLYLKLDRYREASESTAAAAVLAPSTPSELIELAKRLVYFNRSGAMADLAGRLLAKPLWHAAAEADFAALLSMLGEQASALELLERAMGAMRSTSAALYNRSQMRLYSGRMAESEQDLRQCLLIEPSLAKAYWALSKLPFAAAADDEIGAMRDLALRCSEDSQDRAFLQFALFNRLDRAGRYEEAWNALESGCRAKRKSLSYDPAQARIYFEALMRTPFAAMRARAVESSGTGIAPTIPIFIVGMHRSGTTLLQRVLGNHPSVSEAGELYDFPAQLRWAIGRHFSGSSDPSILDRFDCIDFDLVGRRYLDHVAWRAGGRRYLIDKLPSNFVNIGYIAAALPQAKVIHMRRDPMDTCFSNLKELFSNACAYSYDQDELADHYRMYCELMAHWRQALPGFVLDVSYEALIENPEHEAKRILDFCGLDWRPECVDLDRNTRAVNTASSGQVREPIHRRNVDAWKRYAPYLTRLRASLGS
jgi:tetratricopeptide (TPR) repeat protein